MENGLQTNKQKAITRAAAGYARQLKMWVTPETKSSFKMGVIVSGLVVASRLRKLLFCLKVRKKPLFSLCKYQKPPDDFNFCN